MRYSLNQTMNKSQSFVSLRRWFTLPDASGLNWPRVLAVAGALIFALFIWPTPYSHYKSGSTNYRVNRFTGSTERLTGAGWQ